MFHTVKTLKKLGCNRGAYLRATVLANPSNLQETMKVANIILGGHGVEGAMDSDGFWLTYVNMGDTYDMTLTYYKGKYSYCSWGDIVEANMEKFDN